MVSFEYVTLSTDGHFSSWEPIKIVCSRSREVWKLCFYGPLPSLWKAALCQAVYSILEHRSGRVVSSPSEIHSIFMPTDVRAGGPHALLIFVAVCATIGIITRCRDAPTKHLLGISVVPEESASSQTSFVLIIYTTHFSRAYENLKLEEVATMPLLIKQYLSISLQTISV